MAGVFLGMIQVQVPPGVQEGQIVTVVDPNTNQPFSVQVPVGLQPGHVFSCALPTLPLGSSLKERLANVGGKLILQLPERTPNMARLFLDSKQVQQLLPWLF